MFDYSISEIETIDGFLDQKLAWASDRSALSEQMALDASRLLSCTEERLEIFSGQGFFRRCWFTLSGKIGEADRANGKDLIEMQKYAWRYINLLQERDLLAAHAIIAVKNNLLTLAVDQNDIRKEVDRLAGRVYSRFTALEERVGNIEASQRIHGWLLTIDTRDYDEIFSKNLRLLRVVSDFYALKSDSWNVTEIKYLHKALKEVGLDIKETIGISRFINELMDEIDAREYAEFSALVTRGGEDTFDDDFVIESISAPAFSSMYQIKKNYTTSSRIIKSLQKQLAIDHAGAIKIVLSDFIAEQGIDTRVEIPLKDLATEILSCFSLVRRLAGEHRSDSSAKIDLVDKKLGGLQAADHSGDEVRSKGRLNTALRPEDSSRAVSGQNDALSPSDHDANDDSMSKSTESIREKILRIYKGLNIDYSIQKCIEAGKKGEENAWDCLFNLYLEDENFEEAAKWLTKAAEAGNPSAQCVLGRWYENGKGVGKDLTKAASWLRRSAEQGDPGALVHLESIENGSISAIRSGDLYALLSVCSNEELDPLVKIILTASINGLDQKPEYKVFAPDHSKYVKCIGDEIRSFGGHSLRNALRGEGPPYGEIVSDICQKFDIPHVGGIKKNEESILNRFIPVEFDELTADDIAATIDIVRSEATSLKGNKARAAGIAAAIFSAPLTAMVVANSAMSEAYRITAPCVFYIAYLRKKFMIRARSE